MRNTITSLTAATVFAVISAACPAQTSTNTITLQAKVEGVADGTANVVVKFFDTLTGGTQQGATITLNNQPVSGGIINVPVSPIDPTVFNGQTRYMEVTVNGSILSPRTLVTSVPLSMRTLGLVGPTIPVAGQVLSLRFQDTSDPEWGQDGGWALGSAFTPGNFGLVRRRGAPDASRSVVVTPEGTVGIGLANPSTSYKLHVNGYTNTDRVYFSEGLYFSGQPNVYNLHLEPDRLAFEGFTLLFRAQGDGVLLMRNTLAQFYKPVSVPVLTITGADVAEPFNIAQSDTLPEPEPGMVVSIDPANPGKLVVCATPYDNKVAGAISGAGGLSVGVVMGKDNVDPLISGDHPVAMSGRVYVWCDAASGEIRPGDRLTTSSTPGHAMKATDPTQWDGAVIGKAMTELKDGKGLVLVLVNLQ